MFIFGRINRLEIKLVRVDSKLEALLELMNRLEKFPSDYVDDVIRLRVEKAVLEKKIEQIRSLSCTKDTQTSNVKVPEL